MNLSVPSRNAIGKAWYRETTQRHWGTGGEPQDASVSRPSLWAHYLALVTGLNARPEAAEAVPMVSEGADRYQPRTTTTTSTAIGPPRR